ncbi:MAG TPA: HlyD family efflux transporter periplasmic adaptor subunit [Pirellulales bacterium]|nr:HlyD family efflux transporter periplasmic adaptor subunit [Pirellulales bacterium]
MLKVVLATLGIAVLAALGVVIDADSRQSSRVEPEESSSNWIYAPGRVEGATEEIELRPQLRDRIVEILVREGDVVDAGTVLLRLDGTTQHHECAMAEAELEIASAELEKLENGARYEELREAQAELRAMEARLTGAQDRLKRTGNLRQRGATSQLDVVADSTEVQTLSAQVEAAQARLDLLQAPPRDDDLRRARGRVAGVRARLNLARRDLEKTSLQAPCAGQVLKVHPKVGELAGPDTAEPAVIMADTSATCVRAFVEELDAPRMTAGLPVTVDADGLPGRYFRGRVTRLAPRMSRKRLWTDDPAEQFDSKVRELWIELEDAKALIVGLRVDVRIQLNPPPEKASQGLPR